MRSYDLKNSGTLLVACSLNYAPDVAKNWAVSARLSGFAGDIVILTDMPPAEYSALLSENVLIVQIERASKLGMLALEKFWRFKRAAPHVERFYHIYEFIRNLNYDHIITTDITDVVFQTDPTHLIESAIPNYLLVGGEGLNIEHEKWGFKNLCDSVGLKEAERIQSKEVLNVGVLVGSANAIKTILHFIANCAIGRADPIADQAMFNWVAHNALLDIQLKITTYDCAEIVHLGTLLDPRIKEEYSVYHNHGKLPYFKAGQYYNPTGQLYAIVHQYDRVPTNPILIYQK
jgi:hypothetical protein